MHCRAVDECLNVTLFGALGNACETLEEWRENYNWAQTTFSNAQPQPMEFLRRKAMKKMAA
jgi:putative transposase